MAVDWRRMEWMLTEELVDFRMSIDQPRVSDRQELRGLAILWFATFLPEALPKRFRRFLRATVTELRARGDWGTFLWYRAVSLECALFALDGDRADAATVISNVNHHNRNLRGFANECLAHIADRLSFSDQEFRDRVVANLRSRQMGARDTLLALLAARGEVDSKRALLRELDECDLAADAAAAVDDLLNGSPASNPDIPVGFGETLLYCTVELAQPFPSKEQLALPGFRKEDLEPSGGREPVPDLLGFDIWDVVSGRVRAHPLTGPVFRLRP